MACLSDVLLSVQCCTDADLSCANARVTAVGLSKHQLRGSLPEQLGELGALRSLKLHDNFLTGTFPLSLGKLHWLQELQLSHNQFAMQAHADLSNMLDGMLRLQTLDLGMSNEVADLHRSIILPAPPFDCRVGEPCGFTVSTRTVAGLPLSHGGLQVRVQVLRGPAADLCEQAKADANVYAPRKTDINNTNALRIKEAEGFLTINSTMHMGVLSGTVMNGTMQTGAPTDTTAHVDPQNEVKICGQLCTDLMDGGYDCQLPLSWTATQGVFDFAVSSAGQEFVPIRTLIDPTTGVVSTQDTYQLLAVLVAPIECTAAHAHPDEEGAQCMCGAGYYRRATTTGGFSCEHCDRGYEPVEEGAHCSLCVPGKYSATGEGCAVCPRGSEPNLLSGADSCIPCGGHSVSEGGGRCTKCEADQVADPSRTVCVCPAGLYNSSRVGGHLVQCVPKNLRGESRKAASSCASCDGLPCVKCATGLEVVPGWGTTGAAGGGSPWVVFGCPFRHACINAVDGQRCVVGHTGILCAECEPGYGLTGTHANSFISLQLE
jgi:hypothetical protein